MLTEAQQWYLDRISPDQTVVIQPYDPRIEEVVGNLIRELSAIVPDQPIRHLGAAALKISGQNDVDLYILCSQDQFPDYLSKLVEMLGEPSLQKADHVEWATHRAGFEVTIYLTDPASEPMQEQIRTFELLNESDRLRSEYETLKAGLNGQSLRQYQQQKYEFYNRILGIDKA